jgi:hypothetical protein
MSFQPNQLGIYDLGGNLWEWIGDWDERRRDRILRGAGYADSIPNKLNSAGSLYHLPDKRFNFFGFRCVLELPDGQVAKAPESLPDSPRTDGLVANGEWQDVLDRLDQNRLLVKGDWTKTAAGGNGVGVQLSDKLSFQCWLRGCWFGGASAGVGEMGSGDMKHGKSRVPAAFPGEK